MSARRWLRYLAVASIVACLACGDYTASTSPVRKKVSPTTPVNGRYSRYILISGVWTCVEDCDTQGDPGDPGGSIEGFPPATDSLPIQALPLDSIPLDTIPQ